MFAQGAQGVARDDRKMRRRKVPRATTEASLPGNREELPSLPADSPVGKIDRINALPARARDKTPRFDTDEELALHLRAHLMVRLMASRTSVNTFGNACKYAEAFFKIQHPGVDDRQRERVITAVVPTLLQQRPIHSMIHQQQKSDGLVPIRPINTIDPVLHVADLNSLIGGQQLVEPTLGERVGAAAAFGWQLAYPQLAAGAVTVVSAMVGRTLPQLVSPRLSMAIAGTAGVCAAMASAINYVPAVRAHRATLRQVRQVVPDI